METLCHQSDAAKKIEEIATGILSKNLKFVRQLKEVENRDKEQMKALEERVARDKVSTRYCVTCSDKLTNNQTASLIADAILMELEAAQLVARFDDNALEMEKDWEWMSEFDKDEIVNKKIIREL